MKYRVDLRDCVLQLSNRIREIEAKFKIELSEETKDLFLDLQRDVILGGIDDALNVKEKVE